MSETHFTKLDWRPGKRRRTYPRVRSYGGQKEAPLAFLVMAQFVGLNTKRAARCTRIARRTGRRCKLPAMKGCTLCLCHGGAGIAAKKRPYVRTKRGQRKQAGQALTPVSPQNFTKPAPKPGTRAYPLSRLTPVPPGKSGKIGEKWPAHVSGTPLPPRCQYPGLPCTPR